MFKFYGKVGRKAAQEQYREIKRKLQWYATAQGRSEQFEAEQALMDGFLSVEVSTGWYARFYEKKIRKFRIELFTGDLDLVRLKGELDEDQNPFAIVMQYRNWRGEWVTYNETERQVLEVYCGFFCFEE